MKTHKLLKISLAYSLLLFVLPACPVTEGPTPFPTPYPTPYAPTPTSTTEDIEPTPQPEPISSSLIGTGVKPLPAFAFSEQANGDIYSDSFKLEFGPGSKNVKLEFGPGSKPVSLEFGPGSKGPQNLNINLGFPKVLVDPTLQPFSIQQLALGGTLFDQLNVEISRDNQLYATASVLRRREQMSVPARFHPGVYTIAVVAQTKDGPRQMSWSKMEILPEYNAELKVSVFGAATRNPKI